MFLETKTVAPISLSQATKQTRIISSTTTTKTITDPRESQKRFTHPVRHVERQTTPQKNATMEPRQPKERLPSKEDRKESQVQDRANQNDSNETTQTPAQNLNRKRHVFTPELRLTDRRLINFHRSLRLSGSNPGRLI